MPAAGPGLINRIPHRVQLIEVGTRDGFQFETEIVPTHLKIEIIEEMISAGLKEIQVTSFVHPKRVPQMRDAEQLVKLLPDNKDVVFTGLVLNSKGVQRAHEAGMKHIEISISASDTHSRKNTGLSLDKAVQEGQEMTALAKRFGMTVRASIQCAFGCVFEGHIADVQVIRIAGSFLSSGADGLALADTTGMGSPVQMQRLLNSFSNEISFLPFSLHLHDTRGLGLVNLIAAMECGVTRFDTSMGGMGGCPFIPGASGNISTEDTAWLLHSMGIQTGLNIDKLTACTKRLEHFFGKRLPSRISGIFAKQ